MNVFEISGLLESLLSLAEKMEYLNWALVELIKLVAKDCLRIAISKIVQLTADTDILIGSREFFYGEGSRK